jgi:hypothetical protein
MRVLRFFLTSLVMLAIVAGLGFLVTREALLFWGMSTLRSSVSRMRTASVNLEPYVRDCQKRGGSDLSESIIERIQTKFTSSSEFQVEIICRQFFLDPIIVETKMLPPFVMKAAGSSGLVWDAASTSVTLEVWGRQRSLILEENQPTYTNQTPSTPLGSGPVAACQGYGFSCCSLETAQGEGDQITAANDCPKSCFSSCVSRPIVLSFSSDPFYDPENRQLAIKASESVVFSYVLDFGGQPMGTVTIDFGDGKSESFTESDGTVNHEYSCAQAQCQYLARVKAEDPRGITSADSAVTKITVVVTP